MVSKRIPTRLITGNFGKLKITLSPFVYIDEVCSVVDIPAGFIFDGASIPRFAWSLLGVTPYDPRVVTAAVIHDWMYNSKVRSKSDSDSVFLNIMKHQKLLSKYQIKLMYYSVKFFGHSSYNRNLVEDHYLCPEVVIDYLR